MLTLFLRGALWESGAVAAASVTAITPSNLMFELLATVLTPSGFASSILARLLAEATTVLMLRDLLPDDLGVLRFVFVDFFFDGRH